MKKLLLIAILLVLLLLPAMTSSTTTVKATSTVDFCYSGWQYRWTEYDTFGDCISITRVFTCPDSGEEIRCQKLSCDGYDILDGCF